MYRANSVEGITLVRKKNEVLFLKNNHFLYLQANKGFCSKKITYDTKYLWINYFLETDGKQKTIQFFKDLEQKMVQELGSKIHTFYNNNGFGTALQNFGGKPVLDCYISKDIRMSLEDCPEKYYISPLLWIHNARFVEDRWYLNIKLVQCMIFPIYQRFGECLIDEVIHYERTVPDKCKETDGSMSKIRLLDHPTYGKYFKMIQMGIPHMAVEMKFKNELGMEKIAILKSKADDLIEIKYVKRKEHPRYSRFFKMLAMGIPRIAVEQKMRLEGVNDTAFLDEPDKMIMETDEIRNDFASLLMNRKLNDVVVKTDTIMRPDINSIKKKGSMSLLAVQINMEELLKNRNKILGNL